MAIILQNLVLQLNKIREIRENLATQKFPGIQSLQEEEERP